MTAQPDGAPGPCNRPSPVCVTGAAGYVGSHVVRELLDRGYEVRATVRPDPSGPKTDLLRSLGPMEVHLADLSAPGAFDAPIAGCRSVVHLASPMRFGRRNRRRTVELAVEGTLSVLRAAARAGTVRRVVLTSSVAAVVDPLRLPGHVHTEADWNESATIRSDPYATAKREAERAAFAYWEELPRASRFELTAVHPGFSLGPVWCEAHLRSTPGLVRGLLERRHPCPELPVSLVDVRDVAVAHAQALEASELSPRYVVTDRTLLLPEIARLATGPPRGIRQAARPMPRIAAHAAALLDPRQSFEHVHRQLGRRPVLSSGRARSELGLHLRRAEEGIVSCARSITERGWARSPGRLTSWL